MSNTEVALALALGLAIVACVGLALGRAGLAARAGAAEAEARRAGEELARAEVRGAEERRAAEGRVSDLQRAVEERMRLVAERGNEVARLEQQLDSEREIHAEKARDLEERRKDLIERVAEINAQFENTFRGLAQNALSQSQKQFLELAEQRFSTLQTQARGDLEKRQQAIDALIRPIGLGIEQTQRALEEFKQQRAAAEARLDTELKGMGALANDLRTNTGELVNLLQKPKALGDWGELQLRRVAELAGMKEYCDFDEQVQVVDNDGEKYRPDMVVKLPDGLVIAVDAKASLTAFARAAGAAEEAEREKCLAEFSGHLAQRVKELGQKAYYRFFPGSPQITVLFLPGEQLLDRALSTRPGLIEEAASARVVFATPASLIALIRTAALAWQQRDLAQQFEELRRLGVELHKRVRVVLRHAAALGKDLGGAVESYNNLVKSAERNLLSTARKFEKVRIMSSGSFIEGKEVPLVIDGAPEEPQRALPPIDDSDPALFGEEELSGPGAGTGSGGDEKL